MLYGKYKPVPKILIFTYANDILFNNIVDNIIS